MQRSIVVSVLSFAAGAGASYLWLQNAGESQPARSADDPAVSRSLPEVSGSDPVVSADLPIARRARVYLAVADATPDELRSLARTALAAFDDPASRFELDAALTRLIEIDPDAGLAFARTENLDPDVALGVAIDVAEAEGFSEQMFDTVLAALPQLDRGQFRMRVLQRLAASDPAEALRRALADFDNGNAAGPALGPFQSTDAQILITIGTAWAARDYSGALAAIGTIDDAAARSLFAQAVVGRLAQTDPALALEQVEVLNAPTQQKLMMMQTALSQLASRDPVRAVQYAESLDGQPGQIALITTVQQWAQHDVENALAYVQAMPGSATKQNLLTQVALAYGRTSPDAALAWAQSVQTGRADIYGAVVSGIARSDPELALNLAFGDTASGRTQLPVLVNVIMGIVGNGQMRPDAVADRVMTIANPQMQQQALQMLANVWSTSDPEGALDWFISNQASMDRNMIPELARQLGRQSPQIAARYTGRIPPEMRGDWINAIAGSYAQVDPDGARSWVQQFRGEPTYEPAVTEIIRHSAMSDPAGAATLWAATSFSDVDTPVQLAHVLAASWASQDWPAARNWIASIPRNEARDGALAGMIDARPELPDPSLLNLFADDGRRTNAIFGLIGQMAQSDPARAREFATQYLDDAAMRQQAEQIITNAAARRNSIGFISPGGLPALGIREGVFIRQ